MKLKKLASLLIPTFLSLNILGCIEVNLKSSSADSTDSSSADSCETFECFQMIKQKAQQNVQELVGPCSASNECRVVAFDLICKKSYTSILESKLATYDKIVENFLDAIESQEEWGYACTMEWSPTYDINNYEARCVENKCQAIYIGEDTEL